jgi:RNA 2',3'-cyclic 3'-phosphodiesterase
MAQEEIWRTFLALEMPLALRQEILREIEDLKERLAPNRIRLKWAKEEQLHLTLRFFGDTNAEERETIAQATTETLAGWAPFDVTVEQLGCFPSWQRPRVLWLGLKDPTTHLQSLHKALDEAFFAAGLGRDDKKKFHPHITLARIRDSAPGSLKRALHDRPVPSLGQAPVNELVLFRSELRPTGAVYTPLHRFPLR